MLFGLTKKICPLMSLLALVVGCGKKINDPETSDAGGSHIEPLKPSSTLILEVKTNTSLKKSYTLPFSAYFYFPTKLTMKQGDAAGVSVQFTYDIDKNGEWDYRCYYTATVETTEIPFVKCLNNEGADLHQDPDQIGTVPWYQGKGHRVEMEVISGSEPDQVIESVFSVDWN